MNSAADTPSSTSCLYLIHTIFESLSERERRIAAYILDDPASAVHLSIEELAESAEVSVSTLVRFVKKLGYRGYQHFRIALASEALSPEAKIYEMKVNRDEDPVSLAFGAASRALELTAAMVDRGALKDLADRVARGGSICVFGLGGSAVVAQDAMHKLIRTGIRCVYAEDYHMQLMIASQLGGDDTALLISHTGVNVDALSIAETVKKSGAYLAIITSYPRSALARMADMSFFSASSGSTGVSEAFSARNAQFALIDALYIAVMERLGSEGIRSVERMRAAIAKRRL